VRPAKSKEKVSLPSHPPIAFHTTDNLPVDEELVMKFESELQMEKEMRDSDELPVNVRDYLDNGPFEVCPPLLLHIHIIDPSH
jgi:hypothetical protein